ncbi:MAG: glycine-rich domain-containing protein, partial [Actinomycetes bacterium]
MFSRPSLSRAVLAIIGAMAVFASGFAITTNVVTAAPTAIFSEDFNSITQTNTGTQAHTGLTVGAWDSLAGWTGAGTHAIHDVDRILGAGKDIAVSFYNNNEITLTTGFAANTSGVVYTMTFDVGPSVWAGASQASNSTDGLVVSLLRANGTTVASTAQLSGAWNGTATAQDAMTSRTFAYMGDGTGVVRIKVANINPSADRFGGAIDNIVVTQGAPACIPVTSPSGSDTVVSFKTVGLCAWTVPSTVSSVQYLVVAGGGGGGGDAAGGGGAGGLLTNYGGTALSVTPSESLVIGVGSGGVAGHNGPSNDPGGHIKPTAGGNSQFGSVIAYGGGFGGNYNSGNGGIGGSGGGGAYSGGSAGAGTSGQGNAGGNSAGGGSGPAGGGGGGAGGVGTAGNTAQGQGGPGTSVAITGSAVTYAGGGGGGRWYVNGTAPGANNGGDGGGGAGSIGCGSRAADAVANTGGGGGGAPAGCFGDGGSGGSGIVIVCYSTPVAPSINAIPEVSGTTRTGSTLTATTGSWLGSPTSYAYQWKRASSAGGSYSDISSATSSTYVLTDADIDKYIKVSVVATNGVGSSTAATSVATSVIVDLTDSVVPTATTPVATAIGYTFTISNYSSSYTYALTTTKGSVSRSTDAVTVTGLTAGESATVTIAVTRTNYKPASKTVTGSATPATTTTTSTTTTAAPALSIVIQAPVTTVAQGQASVATIAPTTTTLPVLGANGSPVPTTTTTSTTIPLTQSKAVVTTTLPRTVTTTTVGPPVVDKVDAGQTAVQVDGVKTDATVTRENNQMVVTAGSLSATLSGLDKTGKRSPLDSDGNIHLAAGDE